MTKGLEVLRVQPGTTVIDGRDVVDIRGRLSAAVRQALNTERVPSQIPLSHLAPATVIPTTMRRHAVIAQPGPYSKLAISLGGCWNRTRQVQPSCVEGSIIYQSTVFNCKPYVMQA